jgi:hypothetical protein
LAVGTCVDAELVYYPASYALRATVKQRFGSARPLDQIASGQSNDDLAKCYSDALCLNPWVEVLAGCLGATVPIIQDQKWHLSGPEGHLIGISPLFRSRWALMALSGGHPISVFGEWDGRMLLPLSALADGRFIDFAV